MSEDKSTNPESTFYILLRVKGASTEKHATEHCTVASMGHLNDLTESIERIYGMGKFLFPLTATVIGTDAFGEKKDIPVVLLKFDKIISEEFIRQLWNDFDLKVFPDYTPHITIVKDSKFNWKVGDVIEFDSIYVSQYEEDITIFSEYHENH